MDKIVFLTYNATGTAQFRCTREVMEEAGPPYEAWSYREDDRFSAEATLWIDIAAKIVGDAVTELEVEHVQTY